MRKTAEEIIRNLEKRVSRLEKQAIQFEQPIVPGQWSTDKSVAYESTLMDRMFLRTFEDQLTKFLKKKLDKPKNINISMKKVEGKQDKIIATGKIFFMWGGDPYEFPIFVSQGGNKHRNSRQLLLPQKLYLHVGTPTKDLGKWLTIDPQVTYSNREPADQNRNLYADPIIYQTVTGVGFNGQRGMLGFRDIMEKGTEEFYGRVARLNKKSSRDDDLELALAIKEYIEEYNNGSLEDLRKDPSYALTMDELENTFPRLSRTIKSWDRRGLLEYHSGTVERKTQYGNHLYDEDWDLTTLNEKGGKLVLELLGLL